jgi:hypothetical protein
MRTNKEISEALKKTREDMERITKRMEQEGSHSPYSQNIEEYTLHDNLTGLIARKLTLEWVLLKNYC